MKFIRAQTNVRDRGIVKVFFFPDEGFSKINNLEMFIIHVT